MWSTHFLILLDIAVCYPKHCAVITGFVNKLDCLWETVTGVPYLEYGSAASVFVLVCM